MKTSDFDYHLPESAIAQTPAEPRDSARLLVASRESGALTHAHFYELDRFLNPGDLLVFNQTRVIPARLDARKIPTGGRVELLLLRRRSPQTWEAMVGGKRVGPGLRLALGDGLEAEVTADLGGVRREVRFSAPVTPHLEQIGRAPLPPYIKGWQGDPSRYQTVFAQEDGSVAAPTAGLHFTPALLDRLAGSEINLAWVTLHIGLDTFAPVTEESPAGHAIHSEWCQLPPETADTVERTRRNGKRVVAVGTTVVRTLETAARQADPASVVAPWEGPTDLFILPGHEFRAVDALITNFHLPRSTLLMLVSAFWDREKLLNAYEVARREGYRFYSFGDAMFLI
jgi:S-adenosylmethionine:tRNA ribosyltransferase-isomerase